MSKAPTFAVSRWVFLRLLGLIYLIAFVSLGSQVLGLIGSRGILPAQEYLDAVRAQFGPWVVWQLPTLCWLGAGDAMLRSLCLAGAAVSVLLICDVAPAVCAFAAWGLYLSLCSVGQEFLSFQWDALLLEAGFLAIFFAPLRLRPRAEGDAPSQPVVRWLLWWLLFRLMISSGIVKLASGDPTWRHLTALTYHYETQPLPTLIGWYAHQLPAAFHQFSCAVMFAIELAVPWLILGPSRVRRGACAALIALQILIAITGNYGIFNLLTITLCLLLLDDAVWPRALRERVQAPAQLRWSRWVIGPVAAALLLGSVVQAGDLFRLRQAWPRSVRRLNAALESWQLVHGYGLFAVMTTSRPSVIIEGSEDGQTWTPYRFRYQADDVRQAPGFVAPHMPRLDWQLWFAGLGTSYHQSPWVLRLCDRLLEGSPEVLALLDGNPFPSHPPRYVRAMLYDYRFTDLATKRATGAWWQRTERDAYTPVVTLTEAPGRS